MLASNFNFVPGKSKERGFDVVPIIFDGASTNVKVAKKLLKLLNENEEKNLFQ